MLLIAEPGHCPLIPQPTPNIIAPMIVFLFKVLCLGLNSPNNIGFSRNFGIMFIEIAAGIIAEIISSINPRSSNLRKDKTISGLDIPPYASPKPKIVPPMNNTVFFLFNYIASKSSMILAVIIPTARKVNVA